MTASSTKPRRLIWSSQTHQGRFRRNNEDAFLCLRFNHEELNFLGKRGDLSLADYEYIFAVSDGMGGGNAGEFASKIILETVTELVSRELQRNVRQQSQPPEKLLFDFCQSIHQRARHVSQYYSECRGMGATLSLCWLSSSQLHFLHVGDSRIYLLSGQGEFRQLSDDHTVPGRLLKAGEITEKEARSHPLRNQLEQSVGCNPEPVEPQIESLTVNPGDDLVLCSDGITDGIWDRNIEKYVRNPPPYLVDSPPAERLVKEALATSGRDNLTALVLEIRH